MGREWWLVLLANSPCLQHTPHDKRESLVQPGTRSERLLFQRFTHVWGTATSRSHVPVPHLLRRRKWNWARRPSTYQGCVLAECCGIPLEEWRPAGNRQHGRATRKNFFHWPKETSGFLNKQLWVFLTVPVYIERVSRVFKSFIYFHTLCT